MTGIKNYRILHRIAMEELARITGVSRPTLKKMEEAVSPDSISASKYKKVADALKVPMDELISNDFPNIEERGSVRVSRQSKVDNKYNYISVYRTKKGLTYQRLANALGVGSRQRAQQICCGGVPSTKHIATLASCENITIDEFTRKYSFKENCL